MLSEAELAAALSMSRTPVRAALARLQQEGWVSIYPQRGALVRELSQTEVREAAQVRHALETAGVREADEAALARLGAASTAVLAEQGTALRRGDFPGFTALAMRFHRAFVEAAGNRLMLDTYDRLQDLQQLTIVRSAARITGEPDRVLDEHRSLLDAASAGDWVSFATRLRDHQAAAHGLEA